MAADAQRVSERDRQRALRQQRGRPQPPKRRRKAETAPPGDGQED